jgi:hypothetical protein
MNRLSLRTLLIAVVVTATMVVAGVASLRSTAVVDTPTQPHTMLIPF